MGTQKMTGEELIQQFEDGMTPASTFHHADHVRLAFEYLCRFPALEALERFSGALKRFATAQGKAERYHETITWAYLLLIRERMARASSSPSSNAQTRYEQTCSAQTSCAEIWEEFAARNPDLLVWKDGVLATLYRPETLDSDLARQTFVLPDRSCH